MIEYVNKWKNVRFRCAGIAQPGSRDEVVSLVNEARKAGRRLKAVGGGHSFNNNVKTEDILVDLSRLNRVVAIDAGRGTATLEAGITLSDAIVALDAAGLHFPSLGSWSAQSIAGAIATSTHGSTLHHGTLSDIVLGVEAVLSDGSVIETAGDDVRMKALRTSLGQLALLTRVEIACTPAFMLACAIRVVPEEEGFATIGAIAHAEEYASMLWLPYVEQACIRVLRRTDARTRDQTAIDRAEAAVHRTRLDKTFEDLKDYVAGQAFLRLPRLFARSYSGLVRAAFLEDDGVVDKSYNIFRYDKYREPNSNHYLRLILNTEHAINVTQLDGALRGIKRVITDYQASRRLINYPRIHIRLTQGSDKTLLGLNAGRDTAHVGIYIVASIRHKPQIEVARAIEQVLIEHGGRPHWGKFRYVRSDLYKQTYAGLSQFQSLRAELDPIGMFSAGAAMFDDLNNFESPPLGRMFTSLFARDTYFPVRIL